ncbi:MAG: hydroxymethylglutaryl-CoA reductase, partial [Bacteroidota bacterium]
HGGFQTEELGTAKRGHVHFLWRGEPEELESLFSQFEPKLKSRLADVTKNMDARGGGITESWLSNMTSEMENYYVLGLSLETVDSMGANFINSLLEKTAEEFKKFTDEYLPGKLEILMAILSNYTPRSYVKMKVECAVEELVGLNDSIKGVQFAKKFCKAIQIAKSNVSRAVTNNKGIMNGVDAVVIATGNDFRAAEAGSHAYSVSHGKPATLTDCNIENGIFTFRITMPLALGTVGGITRLHPLASRSLEILGNPDAKELMKITAAVGLASNFSAITSLITTGIQQGHMKLHLENILMAFDVDEEMKNKIRAHFKDKKVSHEKVKKFIKKNL